MRRRGALRLALAALVLTCAGCAKQIISTKEAARPAPTMPAHWQIKMAAAPAVPRQLDPTQFQVKITNSQGSPVSGAEVTVSLSMPTMDMGQNEAAAQAGADGVYTATDRFTMPGDWQVTVQAVKGALHQSQSFPVTVQ